MEIEKPFDERCSNVSHTSSDLSLRQTTSDPTPPLRNGHFLGAKHQLFSLAGKAARRIAARLSNYRSRKKMQMSLVAAQASTSALVSEQELSQEFQNCLAEVMIVFPDICPDYLRDLAIAHNTKPDKIINWIIDEQDEGRRYTKKQEPRSKRKRPHDSEDGSAVIDDDEMAKLLQKYDNPDRRTTARNSIRVDLIKNLITKDFPNVPPAFLKELLKQNHQLLFPTYLALENIIATWNDHADPPWAEPFEPTDVPPVTEVRQRQIALAIQASKGDDTSTSLFKELKAARHLRLFREKNREIDKAKAELEWRDQEAEARGETCECECCFIDYPLHRMVFCNGEQSHAFCIDCSRRNAETAVGLTRYELECMSMDGCKGGFSQGERAKFLDKNLSTALDRIECEAVLRMANIENLETCPFCNFAAEYPPIEKDREFRCLNPDCEMVSCRLCRKETHTPQSCEEATRERGYSARREIEEAMSAAMIRRCNKCNTPFVKEQGCNKMTCPQPGCRNMQCYVCSKSCDYKHFRDHGRATRSDGTCPLWEDSEDRHQKEVKEAEETARKLVTEKRPEIDQSHLKFDWSRGVTEDEARRKRGGLPVGVDMRFEPLHDLMPRAGGEEFDPFPMQRLFEGADQEMMDRLLGPLGNEIRGGEPRGGEPRGGEAQGGVEALQADMAPRQQVPALGMGALIPPYFLGPAHLGAAEWLLGGLPPYNHADRVQARYPPRKEARRGHVQQAVQDNAPQQQQQRPQPPEGIASRTRNQLAARARNEELIMRLYNGGPRRFPERGREGQNRQPPPPMNRPDLNQEFRDANGPVLGYHPEDDEMEDEWMGLGTQENRGAGENREDHRPGRKNRGNEARGFQGPGYLNQRRQSQRLQQQPHQDHVRLPRDEPRALAFGEALDNVAPRRFRRPAEYEERPPRPDSVGDGRMTRDLERLPRNPREEWPEPWPPRRGPRERRDAVADIGRDTWAAWGG